MTEPPKIPHPTEPAKSQSQKDKLLNSRPLIFLMLFTVTGFLGIPVLCLSPAFTTGEKVLWSIIVTIYTCILIAITGWILWWSMSRVFGW